MIFRHNEAVFPHQFSMKYYANIFILSHYIDFNIVGLQFHGGMSGMMDIYIYYIYIYHGFISNDYSHDIFMKYILYTIHDIYIYIHMI